MEDRPATVDEDPAQRRDLRLIDRACAGDPDAFNELVVHHQARLAKIYAALEGGPQTAAQVVETIWGERARGFHRFLALVEALSHLERLRREGRVVAEETPAAVLFRAA